MPQNSLRLPGAIALAAASVVAALAFAQPHSSPAISDEAPAYAQNGDMLPPAHYREWTYLSSGIDMSYLPNPAGMTMFDNVFVNPDAYRAFLSTGTWPDKTMLVLEAREARDKGSINQSGHYQGTGVMGIEVHVKDTARFPGGWAFFDFDSPTTNGTLIPAKAPCYACHAAHGAVDTTFVQFYPTLLPVAQKKGTLSPEFLQQNSAPSPAK